MASPRFSIVIPTRNRAHLLRHSLESALRQDYDDYEIVVSDNDSRDDPRAVVDEKGAARVRYVRTDRTMHMPDSWEFALTHARGEYITFLSDDDSISPRLLKSIDEALAGSGCDIAAWGFAGVYVHTNHQDVAKRNSLIAPPVRRAVREIDASQVHEIVMRSGFTHWLPRLINSCAHRSVFDDMRKRVGKVFWPACPDYAVGIGQLEVRKRLRFIEDALLLWGVAKESIGDSANRRGEALQTFLDELRADRADRTEYVPVPVVTAMNYALDSVFRVLRAYGHVDPERELDRVAYYSTIGGELLIGDGLRADIREDVRSFWDTLRKEPLGVRLAVRLQLRAFPGAGAWSRVKSSPAPARFGKALRRTRPHHPVQQVFRGDEYGFSNIQECASALDRLGLVMPA